MAADDQTEASAANTLFGQCHFAFVPSKTLSGAKIAELSKSVANFGAVVVEPTEDGGVPVHLSTHIVSDTIDFPEYEDAMAMMIPVVSSAWITASLQRNKQAQLRPFSPDPRFIFATVNITCADIPASDKEAIIGATLALGGTESKDLNKATTHICALSMDHPKCITAKEKNLKCKIVLPHWFDDCFRLGKRIDEKPYMLPDPEILRVGPEGQLEVPSSQHIEGATTANPDYLPPADDNDDSVRDRLTVFRNKKIMLSQDLSISSRLRKIVRELIQSGDGKVVSDVDECDWFICQYRDGDHYVRAAQSGRDVGNLSWLYHVVTHNAWTSPLRRLLHYPIPRHGIPGFEGLKITLSNYGGEARIYLENLVTAAGATYTKTMKSDNTHLITARMNSEKCDAAQDWNINIVNHLWIEESYAKCEVQSLTNSRYSHFPPRTNLGEIIGQTFFDEARLHATYYPGGGGDDAGGAEGKRKRKIREAVQENADVSGGPAAGVVVGRQEHAGFDIMRDGDAEYAEKTTKEFGVPAPPKESSSSSRTYATPGRGRHVRAGKENDNSPSIVSSASRSAKDKALSKLHNLAPDIALYEKEKKRLSAGGGGVWGGKRAAAQMEKEREVQKTSSPARDGGRGEEAEAEDEDGDDDGDDDDDEGTAKRPAKKKQKNTLPPVEVRVVLTGWKRWVENVHKEDQDRRKLRSLGIQIVQDNLACDYLAAPQIVRTMKFLRTLARGPEVISCKFIEDVLDTGKVPPVKDYTLKDRENERKYGVDLKKSIARARANKGRLLRDVAIYCTADIKNGPENYRLIAEANGAIFKIYRARSGTTIRPTSAEEDGGADPEPVYLLTSQLPAERALWGRFEDMARTGHMEPRVVSPDWLLDIAMKQEVDFDERYLARNFFGE